METPRGFTLNFHLGMIIRYLFIAAVLSWGEPSLLESINKLIWEFAGYIGRL